MQSIQLVHPKTSFTISPGLILMGFVLTYLLFFLHVEFFSSTSDPVLDQLRNQLAEIHPRFRNVELYVGEKSYTINKRKVFICMKDTKGRYYSRNMLCYVILHEYAHMLCDEVDHTNKFQRIFSDLLAKATARGLYDPNIPPISDYCGHN